MWDFLRCFFCQKLEAFDCDQNEDYLRKVEETCRKFQELAATYLIMDPKILPGNSCPDFHSGTISHTCVTCFPVIETFCATYVGWLELQQQLNEKMSFILDVMQKAAMIDPGQGNEENVFRNSLTQSMSISTGGPQNQSLDDLLEEIGSSAVFLSPSSNASQEANHVNPDGAENPADESSIVIANITSDNNHEDYPALSSLQPNIDHNHDPVSVEQVPSSTSGLITTVTEGIRHQNEDHAMEQEENLSPENEKRLNVCITRKPFQCDICGRRYGGLKQLKRHEKEHTNYQVFITVDNNGNGTQSSGNIFSPRSLILPKPTSSAKHIYNNISEADSTSGPKTKRLKGK